MNQSTSPHRLLSTCFITLAALAAPAVAEQIDLLVTNADIWTGDPDQPRADTLVIHDGRFVAVINGKPHKYNAKTTIDAGGRRVIPGITDAHTHIVGAGLQLARVSLREAANRDAFIAAVKQYADGLPPGDWVLGGRWSTESWNDSTHPTKAWIDAATGGRPALLSRMDGHQALANSAALALAGIDRDGPADPVGGRIDRDPTTGEPTGILRDTAMRFVQRVVPTPSLDTRYRALRAAMAEANRNGVTMVHDMSAWSDLDVFARAHREDTLTVRLCVFASVNDWSAYIDDVRAFPIHDDRLRIAGFKGYMDGSLGSRTAYMHEPYNDNGSGQENNRGLLLPLAAKDSELLRQCRAVHAAGLRPAVHAIGDEANHILLNAYETVIRETGDKDWRPRVEHAQHLLPADIERFGQLTVIASMQPFHKADDGRYAEAVIGAERCRSSYAFRELRQFDAPLAFGSDWPVVTVNPFKGVAAAVTGRTLDGKAWMTHQNIPVEEAIRAYTFVGAFAAGMEDRLGRIKKGNLADFVILDSDPFTIDAAKLNDVRVHSTYVDGRCVYRADDKR